MSVQAMSWAIKQTVTTHAPTRHVLLILANYAGEDGGDAFPSIGRIALETGLGERTVKERLKHLCEIGLIEPGNQRIAAAKIDRADRRPVVYQLRFDRWKPEHIKAKTGCVESTSSAHGVRLTTERGAAHDRTGCVSRTQTTIEPSREPSDSCSPASQSSAFDDFWAAYPRKVGKEHARKAFEKAAKKVPIERIAATLAALCCIWPSSPGDPRMKVVPHPATWLNRGGWDDDPKAIRAGLELDPMRLSPADAARREAMREVDWNELGKGMLDD